MACISARMKIELRMIGKYDFKYRNMEQGSGDQYKITIDGLHYKDYRAFVQYKTLTKVLNEGLHHKGANKGAASPASIKLRLVTGSEMKLNCLGGNGI